MASFSAFFEWLMLLMLSTPNFGSMDVKVDTTTTAFSRHRCLVPTLPRTATSSPGSPPDVAVTSRHAQLPNEVPSHAFIFFGMKDNCV